MPAAILIDPFEGAMNSLPSTLKDIFKKIVQKLKSLYKGLIGEFNNRNFAPRTLEDAVLSIYQDSNTYTATDNLNQRVRYVDEIDRNENAVVEYDESRGYASTGQNNQDRTEFNERLRDNSKGDLRVFLDGKFVRDWDVNGLQGKQGRFEGAKLLRGTGNYVGDLKNHISFIRLIQSLSDIPKNIDALSFVKLDKTEANARLFSEALELAKSKNKKGFMVDGKDLETLLSDGVDFYMSNDGNTGFAIERNYTYNDVQKNGVNNIVAVFSADLNGNKANGGIYNIMLNAIEQGGNALDCYADGLQSMYSWFGFKPCAQIAFNDEYLDADSQRLWRFIYTDRGIAYPSVVSMYLNEDINQVADNLKDTMHKVLSLSDVPNLHDYDAVMEGRDKVLQAKFRYSEELDDNDTQDYGDTFNVDNPKSIINRNIRTWDALVD